MFRWISRKISLAIARYLEQPLRYYHPVAITDTEVLKKVLQPGDVLLVEGELRISSAIKYLTQSTWSHSALYVGTLGEREHMLIEADMSDGVRAISLEHYANFNTRICRPVKLADYDRKKLIEYMISRLGHAYDLDNIVDLIRYLLPNPPVPSRWRRGLLELGSGEPTRAICSTVMAQAFQSIGYPIMPRISRRLVTDIDTRQSNYVGVFRQRHHSLFVPRDFDLSPYFQVIKPTLEEGFDYKSTLWTDH